MNKKNIFFSLIIWMFFSVWTNAPSIETGTKVWRKASFKNPKTGPELRQPLTAIRTTKPGPHEEGNIKDINYNYNSISLLKNRFPYLNGSGIVICQKENSFDPSDIDLRDQFIPSPIASGLITDHATEIATIMAGVGFSSPLDEGIAPQAKLISVSFNKMLPEAYEFYKKFNITIVNHSYGTEIENFYGVGANMYDVSVDQNPSLLHVFSSGNLGYSTSSDGKYANLSGYANLTGNYKMAKNVLIVGATDNMGNVLPVSSRGPAYDGRVKPELVVFSDGGTSEAAAIASGASALLQQAYQLQFQKNAPAALLKAVLLNSASDIGVKGLDYQTGYGSVNAFRSVKTIMESRFKEIVVSNGSIQDFDITLPANSQNLKVTLVWTDVPAPANSVKALVNDVDLEVTDGAKTWLPWVLNTFPQIDSLQKIATRAKDTLNNIEQVSIENPSVANYKVRISGHKITSATQTCYVAYEWETKEAFEWIYPFPNAKLQAGSENIIQWENSYATQTGKLELSIDNGTTWQVLSDSVNLGSGGYVWQAPDFSKQILFKMMFGSQIFLSGVCTVSQPLEVVSRFSCPDSLYLNWVNVTDTTENSIFNLYTLSGNDNQWTSIQSFTGNNISLGNITPDDAFAVEPVFSSGLTGIRSDLVLANSIWEACFYDDFSATLTEQVCNLNIELTTTDLIKEIVFEKLTPTGPASLSVQTVNKNVKTYSFADLKINVGVNAYRVKVNLENGKSMYSNVENAILEPDVKINIYPNPVLSGQIIYIIIQDNSPYYFKLYSCDGKIQLQEELLFTQNFVSIPATTAGIYFYEILSADFSVLKRGKIIVN